MTYDFDPPSPTITSEDFQKMIDKETKPIPSLRDFEPGETRVERWFQANPKAETECSLYWVKKGEAKTHRWLVTYFEFPFSPDALSDHARRMKW